MYYLARGGYRNPAEAPHLARVDENYEWGYHQSKHQEAIRDVKGLVDQTAPKTTHPATLRAQVSARRFYEDQKRAEVGRENRKLVDRLSTIARGTSDRGDPRGPPPTSSVVTGCLRGRPRPSAVESANAHAAALTRSKSLNIDGRRKAQRHIDEDNAATVRRILAVRPTFDRKEEARQFKRHEKAVQLLQRLPEPGSTSKRRQVPPRSLPPLRPPRPGRCLTVPLTGLKDLFMPGELSRSLTRSTSVPGTLSQTLGAEDSQSQTLLAPEGAADDGSAPPSPTDALAASDPTPVQRTAVEADLGVQRRARPFSPGGEGLDPENANGQHTRTGGEASAFGDQADEETERRRWLAEEELRRSRAGQSQEEGSSRAESREALSVPGVIGAGGNPWLSGMSEASELPKFTEGWDENSFDNSSVSPPSKSRTGAGGNWRADPGLTVHEEAVSNFGLQGAGTGLGLDAPEDPASQAQALGRTNTGTSYASYASDDFGSASESDYTSAPSISASESVSNFGGSRSTGFGRRR